MQLSAPGSLRYSAVLVGITARAEEVTVTGHFRVSDASGAVHAGISMSGEPQEFLDVEMSTAALPSDINEMVCQRLQVLVLAEYGGDIAALIGAAIQQQLKFGS